MVLNLKYYHGNATYKFKCIYNGGVAVYRLHEQWNRNSVKMEWKTVYSVGGKDYFSINNWQYKVVKAYRKFFWEKLQFRALQGGLKVLFRSQSKASEILLLSFNLNIAIDKWCLAEIITKKEGWDTLSVLKKHCLKNLW